MPISPLLMSGHVCITTDHKLLYRYLLLAWHQKHIFKEEYIIRIMHSICIIYIRISCKLLKVIPIYTIRVYFTVVNWSTRCRLITHLINTLNIAALLCSLTCWLWMVTRSPSWVLPDCFWFIIFLPAPQNSIQSNGCRHSSRDYKLINFGYIRSAKVIGILYAKSCRP